jgi:hypothetical protein
LENKIEMIVEKYQKKSVGYELIIKKSLKNLKENVD